MLKLLLRRADGADSAIYKRILRAADLKVEMRTSRASGRADVSDSLSANNRLSSRNNRRSQVRVECLRAVAVRDDDIVAVTAIPCAVTA